MIENLVGSTFKAEKTENEIIRLINELRGEVNALRNRVNFLEKHKDAE